MKNPAVVLSQPYEVQPSPVMAVNGGDALTAMVPWTDLLHPLAWVVATDLRVAIVAIVMLTFQAVWICRRDGLYTLCTDGWVWGGACVAALYGSAIVLRDLLL